jgi:hypothetical protein
MAESKLFRVLPNPISETQFVQSRLTILDTLEEVYGLLAERTTAMKWLAESVRDGQMLPRDALDEVVAFCEAELSTLGKQIENIQHRRVSAQQQLEEFNARTSTDE